VHRDIGSCVIPCNYLQIMENSLDPVHVEWLHTHFSNYVLKRLGRPDIQRDSFIEANGHPQRHKLIGFDVFDHGIIKRRVMEGQDETHPFWRIGHPIVFPNILKTTGFQYRVPIDDNTTHHWWFFPHRLPEGVEVEPQTEIPYYEVPLPEVEKGRLPWQLLDNNSGQDIMMWITQGGVADRTLEKLSLSDKGVIKYRQLLKDNLDRVAHGEDPMNVFRDPEDNEYLDLPTEYWEMGFARAQAGVYNRTGGSSKYSPVIAEAMRKAGKEDVLAQPVH